MKQVEVEEISIRNSSTSTSTLTFSMPHTGVVVIAQC
jgi:hypothetical protein